jgi:coproporphyrinogen III oxidase-like Fe-S oxidoreductase
MLAGLRAAGVRHIKIDWMAGIPGQTIGMFQKDRDLILRMRADEIVVTPFHPGMNSPLGLLGKSQWPPQLFAMTAQDIARRSQMIRLAREASQTLQRASALAFSPSQERLSTLGLGYGALSRLYGHARYTRTDKVYGVAMDMPREMRGYAIRNLMERGFVSADRFQAVFCKTLDEAFGNEGASLAAAGLLIRSEAGWRVPEAKTVYCRIIGAMLYEGVFKKRFQEQFQAFPMNYRQVEQDLVRLYDVI